MSNKNENEKREYPSPTTEENVESYGTANGIPPISNAEERRLLSKLDKRIVPCIMWMYLMNFMDRGPFHHPKSTSTI